MKILMINLPFSGHTNPTLPLAEELVGRGHKVTYINSLQFKEAIERTGAEFIQYKYFPESPTEDEKKKLCFNAAFRTAMELKEDFDLLIYEMFFYPGYELAKMKGIPSVRQFSQAAWSEATWKEAPWIFKFSARLIDMQVFPVKKAKELGLSLRCLRDGIIKAEPELNIVYVPEAFQSCRDSFDDRWIFMVPEAKASSFRQEIPYGEMKGPIVYVSLGSIMSDRGFCMQVIKGFRDKEFSVILNTGKVDPASLGDIPGNVYAYSFVPQLEVLEHADVFLTHCGMNSINEALEKGVPMVAMPYLNDQITNARQVVALGLGRQVRSLPISGKRMYEAVKGVYEDEQIKENVKKVSLSLKRQVSMEYIAERIEALA